MNLLAFDQMLEKIIYKLRNKRLQIKVLRTWNASYSYFHGKKRRMIFQVDFARRHVTAYRVSKKHLKGFSSTDQSRGKKARGADEGGPTPILRTVQYLT